MVSLFRAPGNPLFIQSPTLSFSWVNFWQMISCSRSLGPWGLCQAKRRLPLLFIQCVNAGKGPQGTFSAS